MHEAKLSLHHDIVTRPLGIGPSLSVSRDGSVDESRVDLVDRLKVQAILFQCPGYVILDEDVTFGR